VDRSSTAVVSKEAAASRDIILLGWDGQHSRN
jgi:hypothetical protein